MSANNQPYSEAQKAMIQKFNAHCCEGPSSFAAPTGLGGKRETPLLLPNDTKIRFCNALNALRRHAAEGTSGECGGCSTYLRHGDGDLCEKGKVIISEQMCYADTSLELPPNSVLGNTAAKTRNANAMDKAT